MSEKLYPQVVSRYLRSQGFARSETMSTRIRGWSVWTAGFDARARGNGVLVDYTNGSRSVNDGQERADRAMAAMRKALEEKYNVTDDGRRGIYVKKKSD